MPELQKLMVDSLGELREIFLWLQEKGEHPVKPTTVLVGGWAVYAFNQYYGSVDIDLVTSRATQNKLTQHLIENMGYKRRRSLESNLRFISKDFESGEVEIDFGARGGSNRFEGRREEMPFALLDDNTETKVIAGLEIPVPTRSLLLLLKMKAAWDRSWRLNNEKSRDPRWELGKLIKDYSDILAILDPNKGGKELDMNLLRKELNRLAFLQIIFQNAKNSTDASEKYGITPGRSTQIIDGLTTRLF